MKVQTRKFGELPTGEEITLFEFENIKGTKISIINYGCTITSIITNDRKGKMQDIITGYDSLEDWLENPAYFGCIVGRTCNRIGNARFTLDGREYQLAANQGKHNLHGGVSGFHKKLWKASLIEETDKATLFLNYLSPDGEEGFPGNLDVEVAYTVTDSNLLLMEIEAKTDKATPVSLTNHMYFNLQGDGSGDIYNHEFLILADHITETDEDLIPTGNFLRVKGTPYDYSYSHLIGDNIHDLPMGFDDNYILKLRTGELSPAIIVYESRLGRAMEIRTTEPGVQLYTANWFDGSIRGKNGAVYNKHYAFAAETQHFPDAVNHPEFPSVILRPGETYSTATSWRFYSK